MDLDREINKTEIQTRRADDMDTVGSMERGRHPRYQALARGLSRAVVWGDACVRVQGRSGTIQEPKFTGQGTHCTGQGIILQFGNLILQARGCILQVRGRILQVRG